MRKTVLRRTISSALAGLGILVVAGFAVPAQAENFSCSVPDSFCSCDGDQSSLDCKAMSRNCANPKLMVCEAGVCWCLMALQVNPGAKQKMSHLPDVPLQSLTSSSGGAGPAYLSGPIAP
jgi:hypothetical protein